MKKIKLIKFYLFMNSIYLLIKAMFVSRNSFSRKPLSKLSCVCLPLGKLVNEKHFPVNRKHFPVNRKHFSVKENFDLVSRKMFSLLAVFVFRKVISGKPLSKLSCVCLPLEKLVNGKHFPEVVKKLEMSLFADYIKFDPQTFDCYL